MSDALWAARLGDGLLHTSAMADDGSRQFLSGSVLEGWYAKNLRNESTGLASWVSMEAARL